MNHHLIPLCCIHHLEKIPVVPAECSKCHSQLYVVDGELCRVSPYHDETEFMFIDPPDSSFHEGPGGDQGYDPTQASRTWVEHRFNLIMFNEANWDVAERLSLTRWAALMDD